MRSLKDMNHAVRRAGDRGETVLPSLRSKHTFSFGDYIDPEHMGFRNLRVINEDVVAGGGGFASHEHRSMEIFTYVIEGALTHEDDMGNRSVINTGEFQYMSAGSGVVHSEMNFSQTEPVHFYQIWLEPKELAGEPSYAKVDLNGSEEVNGLFLVASPCGQDGALKIQQDVEIHIGQLGKNSEFSLTLEDEHPHIWIQVISGALKTHGILLEAGDGFACRECDEIELRALEDAHFIFFRLY